MDNSNADRFPMHNDAANGSVCNDKYPLVLFRGFVGTVFYDSGWRLSH
jgi:hypothetical protein